MTGTKKKCKFRGKWYSPPLAPPNNNKKIKIKFPCTFVYINYTYINKQLFSALIKRLLNFRALRRDQKNSEKEKFHGLRHTRLTCWKVQWRPPRSSTPRSSTQCMLVQPLRGPFIKQTHVPITTRITRIECKPLSGEQRCSGGIEQRCSGGAKVQWRYRAKVQWRYRAKAQWRY